jgi:hypothetical protein
VLDHTPFDRSQILDREISAMPILDRRSPREIMDDLDAV